MANSVTLASASTSMSACNTGLSQTRESSEKNNNTHRDASFSSYLNGAEDNFVAKLESSTRSLNSLASGEYGQLYLGKKKVEYEEIDVFGAEKYFNGKVEVKNPKTAKKDEIRCQTRGDDSVDVCPDMPKVQPGTPSVCSESSWNSRIALLPSIPRNRPHKRTEENHGKSFLGSLGCNCSCIGKESVDIEGQFKDTSKRTDSNDVTHGKAIIKEAMKDGDLIQIGKCCSSSLVRNHTHSRKFNDLGHGLSTEDRFTFPILKSELGNLAVKIQLQEGDDEKTRKSLEVFGSPVTQKGKKNSRIHRRLDMLTWDAIRQRLAENQVPDSSAGVCNDTESDASSDLFEIESFTNTPNSFLTRQASDGMSTCVTPTTCYAPSEASIDQSVAIASAADSSSFMSDMRIQQGKTLKGVSEKHKRVRKYRNAALAIFQVVGVRKL